MDSPCIKQTVCKVLKIFQYGKYLVAYVLKVFASSKYGSTVKPVQNGHTKMNKTKVLKTNGSLTKVKSIAECSLGAFCNTLDLH